MNKYSPKKIESKWQRYWEKNKVFEVSEDPSADAQGKQKFYGLVEFPYPSGAGLHVGHPRPFTAMDVICRKKRMQGFNVLYPMGFDAFGLPTENFAIKTGRPPAEVTAENIANFTRQLKMLGYSFAWSRAVDTTDPKYYKWTQWIFLQLFKHGLAYKKTMPINWCPSCKTGLANEEVVTRSTSSGQAASCERCGGPVEKRNKEQWMLAITKYADKLLVGLETVDYIPQAKIQQQNWIGRSEGALVKFKILIENTDGADFYADDADHADAKRSDSRPKGVSQLEVFTTRPDTLFGATYMVIAPEHDLIANFKLQISNFSEVEKYVEQSKKKTDQERSDISKEKTGVELKGVKAINPVNNEELPIFVADYVLGGYGTGAIMAVPAHDERDWEFAKKYGLSIRKVVKPEPLVIIPNNAQNIAAGAPSEITLESECFVSDGIAINSDFLNGLSTPEAKEKMIACLEEKGIGKRKVQFKLRDWVFSRQRYWGEPIPLVYCEKCAKGKPKILYVHGIYGSTNENWVPWFKKEMESRGYEMLIPELPDSDKLVDEKKWIKILKNLPIDKNDKLFVVGHSYGARFACKYIEESEMKVEKFIMVAPTGPSQTEKNYQELRGVGCSDESIKSVDDLSKQRFDWKKLNDLVGETIIYLSDNDPFIPFTMDQSYSELKSVVRRFVGKGHFNKRAGVLQLPELLEEFADNLNPGWIPLPESELPLELPKVEKYEPTDNGESPLAHIDKWVKTKCPVCGGKARRETDTMPNWAGSSWYFLRYTDPQNDATLAAADKLRYWTPVDWYNGGMEHTVLHLLYSRFWNEFLYDIGVVPTSEPYKKRTSHGMILAPDGEKMSKSRGNVINPDEMVEKFGTDTFRTYIMFMGPFDQAVAWDTNGLVGVRRFLEKIWGLGERVIASERSERSNPHVSSKNQEIATSADANRLPRNDRITTLLHQTIKKVTEDIEAMRFNTAVAQLMILVNEMSKDMYHISHITYQVLLQLLSPFAPHMAEELWNKLGNKESISKSKWPEYDPKLIIEDVITVVCQINGKVRDEFQVPVDINEEEIKKLVLASEKVQKWLENKEPKKVIYVKGKLVSIVI